MRKQKQNKPKRTHPWRFNDRRGNPRGLELYQKAERDTREQHRLIDHILSARRYGS